MTTGRVTPAFWKGKRVFLTGHTGFKGAWLAHWLISMGAEVTGYARAPNTDPALFDALELSDRLDHHVGDIRDADTFRTILLQSRPNVVLHLAAQPIVSEGYADPTGTFETNVMGVVHLLEACRALENPAQVLVISSDKCYRNDNSGRAFAIDDPLGGHDPYSASKAGTEIVVGAYAASFFAKGGPVQLASARAGNVVGGGDWSLNRLVPDGARCFSTGVPLVLRNPLATRPWQHVLEPLHGYLSLVEAMALDHSFARPWNFGPVINTHESVGRVAELMVGAWGANARIEITTNAQDWEEAKTLDIDSSVTLDKLRWAPVLDLATTIDWTVAWYRAFYGAPDSAAVRAVTQTQIDDYVALQSRRS
ncbi:CDP-glucose 4,6-dehydratase [uncultured Tateyamaria sp.]|uniref:CDP-glucose 4,6-dehydratase n=1 Tax=uncultured Tateyamaria sp. TaxID=455651 RepID=UPI00342641F1